MDKDNTVFVQLRLQGGGTGPHGICGRMSEFMAKAVEDYLQGKPNALLYVQMREHFSQVMYPSLEGGFKPIGSEYYTHTTVAMNAIAAITKEVVDV